MSVCKARSRGRAVRGNGAFLKEYVYRSLVERLRRRFLSPRPFVALSAAERLAELGVPTPRVLAAVRGVSPDGAIHDILATCELDYGGGVIPGDAFWSGRGAESADEIVREFVPTVCRLHDRGFFHGDLSLRNWYRTADGSWGLIDLDGTVLFERTMPKSRRTRELARLASSWFLAAGGDDRRTLRRTAEKFLECYSACGGRVYERWFFCRTFALVERFRSKYLELGALK